MEEVISKNRRLVAMFSIPHFLFFESYPINLNHSCLDIFRKLTLGIFLQNRSMGKESQNNVDEYIFFLHSINPSYLEITLNAPLP